MEIETSAADWPATDLEHLGECPICDSSQRSLMFDDLADWSFRVAPGRWMMWNCNVCSTAYLDPRPTEASIGRAYESYYTHRDENTSDVEPRGVIRKLKLLAKHRMRKGYYKLVFGYNDASVIELFGGVLFQRIPNMAPQANLIIRNLPRPSASGNRLLDIGCGSGTFLRTAATLGYEPIGIDPDAKAVDAALKSGFEVRHGGLPDTGFPDRHFTHVMLNHVFEHLHRPKEALREIWRILRSGGRLWMALPNRDALGLEIFGKYWRGLEAPRHLVLPTPATLRNLLASTSFSGIAFLEHPRCGGFISESSLAMKAGLDPTDCRSLQPQTAALARKLDRNSHANLNRAEIMIVIAEKNG